MRDEYAASADLCEEHGLAGPAKILRAVAEGSCEAFMVRPHDNFFWDPDRPYPLAEAVVRSRPMFRDREAAVRHVLDLKAASLREYAPTSFDRAYLFNIPEEEFCRKAKAVLKIDYRLPEPLPAPLFPGWATIEQLRELAPFFRDDFFAVVSVTIVPPDEET